MPSRWLTFGQNQPTDSDAPGEDARTDTCTSPIPALGDTWPALLSGLVVLSLALASPPAHGQGASPDELIREGQQAGAEMKLMREVASRSSKAGHSPTDVSAVLRPAVKAAQNDLPSGPILDTALEGLSKEVPSGRLQAAVQQEHARVEASGAFVESWGKRHGPSDLSRPQRLQLVESVAQARRQGLPFEDVQALWETVRDRTVPQGNIPPENGSVSGENARSSPSLLATATTGASLLTEDGLSAEQARVVISAGLKSGHGEAQLRDLVASVLDRRPKTIPPAALARSAGRSARQGFSGAATRANPALGGLPGLGVGGAPPASIASRMGLPGQGPNTPPDKGNPPGKGNPPSR